MMKTRYLAAAVITALATSQAASASDVLPSSDSTFRAWGEESGWNIMVDEGRNACLIERQDENNNVVQMGLTKDHEFGYLGVFTQNAEVKNRKKPIVLSLDGNLYSAEAQGKTKNLADGYVGGYFLTNNPNFVEDVMKKYDMIVFPEDSYAFTVSLEGTLKAIEAARKCNMELNG
ncbi:hypothetical protein R3X27_13740 [Tropicimonas sp. TH_r6]|uniref:hypothetical protein n=1 Tax=Tropicimonas sp. TH_r6 TaxID=3082085 RepID=UPI0029540921|nr:hypothetical protein [Tropicimonas sp. TH_r6]MDV7143744.1 hypothetical protein [Tropicimonas sp. TH_r6]